MRIIVSWKDIIQIILSATIGGSGLCGIVFLFIRFYIEKRLKEREHLEEKEKEIRKKRRKVEEKIQHAQGRVLFWIVRAIETGEHNGELHGAFEELQKAEEEAKDLDREIIAEHDTT